MEAIERKSFAGLTFYAIALAGLLVFALSQFQTAMQKIIGPAQPLSSRILSELPAFCERHEASITNPRPALFIGCGIFE